MSGETTEEKKSVEEPAPSEPAPSKPAPSKPAPSEPAKEPATENKEPTAAAADSASDNTGKRIVKKFDKKLYFGEITEKWTEKKDNAPKWHVKYDDGDEEDFSEKELYNALKRYKKAKRFDFKIFPRKPRKPSEKRKRDPPPPRTNKFPKRRILKKD